MFIDQLQYKFHLRIAVLHKIIKGWPNFIVGHGTSAFGLIGFYNRILHHIYNGEFRFSNSFFM